MNTLSKLLSNEMSHAIGWTIIHSLWQCTLIALAIAISYAFTKKAQAATRYWINTLGLLSCVITSAITFYMNFNSSVKIEIIGSLAINSTQPTHQTVYAQNISEIINQHIHQIVFCWIIGFGLYITKYLADYFYCQHIKHQNNKAPSETMQQIFNELKNCLGINDKLQLRISEAVHIPCVIGHFAPVVLLPTSLILGLSTQQIKVILLHELGHVSRRDYLINSIQTLITSLYFFNPFTRWISSKIDEERENACDDIAVFASGDPLFYANTLKEFAEMKNNYSPAIAMAGKSNLLINRIKRLFICENSFSKTYGKAITIMTLALLGIGFSVSGHSGEENKLEESFTIKLDNEPLSKLLQLSQEFCPTLSNIKLKSGDRAVSLNLSDLKCSSVEHTIKEMDDSLDSLPIGISFNEKNIPLQNLATKIESYCPEAKGKIRLNNPEHLISYKAENVPCSELESNLKEMDINWSDTSTKIATNNIKYESLDEYNKAFFKELDYPTIFAAKRYTVNCATTFTVDTYGSAVDINSICISPNEEEKQHFEKLLSDTARKTKFPIKMENEKPVVVKGIGVRIKTL